MTDKENQKGFIDKFFDTADEVVSRMEQGSKFVHVDGKEDIEDAEIVSMSSVKEAVNKSVLIWGAIDINYHLFEGFAQSSLCGRHFEPGEFKHRKTEMDIDGFVCVCGTCLRILHSRIKSQ